MSRIQQTTPAKSEPPKPMPDWVKWLLVAGVGAVVGSLCQFIPAPPLRAVCMAVSSLVTSSAGMMTPDAGF